MYTYTIEVHNQWTLINQELYNSLKEYQTFKIINNNTEDVQIYISNEEPSEDIQGLSIYGFKQYNEYQKTLNQNTTTPILFTPKKNYYIKNVSNSNKIDIVIEPTITEGFTDITPYHINFVTESISTTPIILGIFRNADTNTSIAKLVNFDMLPFNGEGLVKLKMILNPSLIGVEGNDYNFNNYEDSVLEYCFDYSESLVNGKEMFTMYSYPSSQGNKTSYSLSNVDADRLGLILKPNSLFAITAEISSNTIDIAWSVNWIE